MRMKVNLCKIGFTSGSRVGEENARGLLGKKSTFLVFLSLKIKKQIQIEIPPEAKLKRRVKTDSAKFYIKINGSSLRWHRFEKGKVSSRNASRLACN